MRDAAPHVRRGLCAVVRDMSDDSHDVEASFIADAVTDQACLPACLPAVLL